jgi:serine/threonine-protein kinase
MAAADIDQNLLFGMIALQDDLINQQEFIDACALWTLRVEHPLADVLVERRLITETDRLEIERKIERKIKKHGDVRASLAAAADGNARAFLLTVDHPGVRNSLMCLPRVPGPARLETMIPPHEPEGSRYTLTRLHGEGGLGRVWLARDRELQRGVALKEIRPDLVPDLEVRRRFLKEAQITSQLEHPNIVPVYELARRREDDQPFYTMRFVRGETLLAAIQEFHRGRAGKAPDRLAFQSLLGTFLKVCDAIAYAHARGVVHRDLKPENVVLGSYGEVVVLDWGLAKLVDDPELASEDNTRIRERILVSAEASAAQTLGLLGTPSYMAPEQVEQNHEQIDGRTDVYALGGILFEILTGHPPAEGTTTAQVLEQARTGRIPRARQVEPTVPPPLEAVCAKAMSLASADRYPKVADLAQEVRCWIAGEPVAAYPEPLPARVRRWMRRHRTVTTAATAAMMVALTALGIAYRREATISARLASAKRNLEISNRNLATRNQELDEARKSAEEREQLAIDAVTKFRDAVAQNKQLKNQPELESLRKTLLKAPLEFFHALRAQLRDDSRTGAKAMRSLAFANMSLAYTTFEIGSITDAIQSNSEAIALMGRLASEEPANTEYNMDLAKSHNAMGILEHQTGRQNQALESFRKALAIQERQAREHPDIIEFQSEVAASHNNIGNLQVNTGQAEEALQSYAKALAIQEGLASANPKVTEFLSELAASHDNIGSLQRKTGRMEQALESYDKALAIRDRLARENPGVTDFKSGLARSYNNIGALQNDMNRTEVALDSFNKALAIQESLERDNPSVTEFQSDLAISHASIGNLRRNTGQLRRAFESYGKALAIRERLVRDNPKVTSFLSDLGRSHDDIGILHSAEGHPDQALESFDKALAIREPIAREHPEAPDYASDLGATLNNMASVDLDAKRFKEGSEKLRQAIFWQRKALAANPMNPEYRQFLENHLLNLIKAARELHNVEEAEQAERSLAELAATSPLGIALDARLAAVIRGDTPKDDGERLNLAYRAYEKKLNATAARLFSEALEPNRVLPDGGQGPHRFYAACAAIQAATANTQHSAVKEQKTKTPDAQIVAPGDENKKSPALAAQGVAELTEEALSNAERGKLRLQARYWLEAELETWSHRLESASSQQMRAIAETLSHWQEDAGLAGVRDEAALAQLPESERDAWKSLWKRVDSLRTKASTP